MSKSESSSAQLRSAAAESLVREGGREGERGRGGSGEKGEGGREGGGEGGRGMESSICRVLSECPQAKDRLFSAHLIFAFTVSEKQDV